jgi:hypothetical protein
MWQPLSYFPTPAEGSLPPWVLSLQQAGLSLPALQPFQPPQPQQQASPITPTTAAISTLLLSRARHVFPGLQHPPLT